MGTTYDERFFAWVTFNAHLAARTLLPIVIDHTHPASVLDVGCGQGAWLAIWEELGVRTLLGIDGPYVEQEALVIPRDKFRAIDLVKPWQLDRRFDLVQSLEVAEHLPEASGSNFVTSLCAHSDIVLFSAAQPGQGGERHINERRPSYWAQLFAEHKYFAFDCIRPLVARNREMLPCYRFNPILYANEAGVNRLSESAIATRVSSCGELDQYGNFAWRLRRALLLPLPEPVVTFLIPASL